MRTRISSFTLALLVLTICALAIFLASWYAPRLVPFLTPQLYLIGAAIVGVAAVVSGLNDVLNLVDHFRSRQSQHHLPGEYSPPPLPRSTRLPAPGPQLSGWYIPFQRNPLFTAREQELRELANKVFHRPKYRSMHITAPPIAISGIGGMGKTQLAAEFAYRYGRFTHGVHWLDATRPLEAQLAICGSHMELPNWPHEIPAQAAITLNAWRERPDRLVILDNLDKPDLLQTWQPQFGAVKLLVTTRLAAFPPNLEVETIHLGQLKRPQSITLLRKLTANRRSVSSSGLNLLAERLYDLPLGLHVVGSALAILEGLTPEAYLKELEKAGGALKHRPLPSSLISSPTEHTPDLFATFKVSWDILDPIDPIDQAAQRLFLAASYCAPDTLIPRALVAAALDLPVRGTVMAERGFMDGHSTMLFSTSWATYDSEPGALDLPLHRLSAMGFLENGPDGPIIHSLLAEFGRHVASNLTSSSDEVPPVLSLAKAILRRSTSARQSGLPSRIAPYLPHLMVFAALPLQDSAITGSLLNNLGLCWEVSGDLMKARFYFEKALAIARELPAEHSSLLAAILGNLGSLLGSHGDPHAARPYLEQALAAAQEAPDESDMLTAYSLDKLGVLLRHLGDLSTARSHLEQALAIFQEKLPESHPQFVAILDHLGTLLRDLGDFGAARPYLERALAINRRGLGERHPYTASSLQSLGMLLYSEGDFSAAQRCLEQALAIQQEILGKQHHQSVATLHSLGITLHAQGDLTSARVFLEQALDINRRTRGENHFDTAVILSSLGEAILAQGDLASARACLEQALKINRGIWGEQHSSTVSNLLALVKLLRAQGDLNTARAYSEQAADLSQKIWGDHHPTTATCLNDLGSLLHAQGELHAARQYLEQSLAIVRETCGERHPSTAVTLNNLGLLLHALGDLPAARLYLEQALDIFREILGEKHPDVAAKLNFLGTLSYALGDLTTARHYFEQALHIYESTLLPTHPYCQSVHQYLADIERRSQA